MSISMQRVLITVLALTSLSGALPASAEEVWPTYQNARVGYTICYPPELVAKPVPDSGDGRVFLGRDGAELRVFTEFYAPYDGLLDRLHVELDRLRKSGSTVTYQSTGRNWFVISGRQGSHVFYTRVTWRIDQFIDMQIRYPISRAAHWAPLVSRLTHCLS